MIEVLRDNWSFLLWGYFPNGPIGGLAMTLLIALASLAITFPFAIAMALARAMGPRWLRVAAATYVTVMRGIPLLMLLLWIYFFLPVALGFPLSPFITIVIAIVIFQTAYLSEVIRAGIEALPYGQTEAALSLGLRKPMIVAKIILPQALFNVIPGIINQFTSVVKETSLAYVIALAELTYSASLINAQLMVKPLEVYLVLAMFYFVLCFSLSQVADMLDRSISAKRQASPAR